MVGVEFSPVDDVLVAVSEARKLLFIEPDGATIAAAIKLPGIGQGVAFSSDGLTVAAVCAGGIVNVFDARTQGIRSEANVGKGRVHDIAVNRDGSRIAVALGKEIAILDPSSGTVVQRIPLGGTAHGVLFFHDEAVVAAAAGNKSGFHRLD